MPQTPASRRRSPKSTDRRRVLHVLRALTSPLCGMRRRRWSRNDLNRLSMWWGLGRRLRPKREALPQHCCASFPRLRAIGASRDNCASPVSPRSEP
jgi:hypothetical protein